MFRFLQAFYWTFFCRRTTLKIERRNINPYRELPEGWSNQRDAPESPPVHPAYKVSEEFLLKEDQLAFVDGKRAVHIIFPGTPWADQYWLMEGSNLTITHISSPSFVCVFHTVTEESQKKRQEKYADQGPITGVCERDFARDGQSFIVTFDELARMERLSHRKSPEGWENRRDEPVDPQPLVTRYKVSESFALNEDVFAYRADEAGPLLQMELRLLLKDSILTIRRLAGDDWAVVLHIISENSHSRYQDRYLLNRFPEGYKEDFANDRELFMVSFSELARMRKLEWSYT